MFALAVIDTITISTIIECVLMMLEVLSMFAYVAIGILVVAIIAHAIAWAITR